MSIGGDESARGARVTALSQFNGEIGARRDSQRQRPLPG
jgi:hypothetical protein